MEDLVLVELLIVFRCFRHHQGVSRDNRSTHTTYIIAVSSQLRFYFLVQRNKNWQKNRETWLLYKHH